MSRKQPKRRLFAALLAGALALGGVAVAGAAVTAQAEPELTNFAQGATVTASGTEYNEQTSSQTSWVPERAVDGNVGLVTDEETVTRDKTWRDEGTNFRSPDASRWSSNKDGEAWLALDLGKEVSVDRVTIYWGKQYGKTYVLETSDNGSDWTPVTVNGETSLHAEASKTDTVTLTDVTTQHIRVRITERNSEYSTGIWEFEVWGTEKAAEPENLALLETTEVSASGTEIDPSTNQQTAWTPDRAVDGKVGLTTDTTWQDKEWLTQATNHKNTSASRWSANNEDGAWLALDLGAVANIDHVTVVWGKQFGNPYRIETSADGNEWEVVADTLTGADSETKETKLEGVETRYIRLYVTQRSGQYAASVWEFEVWGTWVDGAPEEPVEAELPSVVPEPVTYTALDDEGFVLSPESDIVYQGDQGEAAKAEAAKLAETLRVSTGYDLEVVAASDDNVADITLSINTEAGNGTEESYELSAGAEGLTLSSPSAHGLYNGIQTVYQLFGPFSVADFTTNGPWNVPALQISDYPRYEWRAVMLDPARSFLTVDEIKQAIDVLSMYKLNVLHLHLTDDHQRWPRPRGHHRLHAPHEDLRPDRDGHHPVPAEPRHHRLLHAAGPQGHRGLRQRAPHRGRARGRHARTLPGHPPCHPAAQLRRVLA